MNLSELEKLAKAAIPPKDWQGYFIDNTNYITAANPQTILAMIELLREMGSALENLERVKGRHHTEQAYNKCMDALQRYKEMTK